MQHFLQINELNNPQPTAVALGMFDGVHLGHQALLKNMAEQARAKGLRTAALTFFPHPRAVLLKRFGRQYLTTVDERAELIGDCDIDQVVTTPFNETTRNIRAADYVELMQKHLGMVEIWSGDFGFGYQREGTADYLRSLQTTTKTPFQVFEYGDKLSAGGDAVSSSRVRNSLDAGNITDAATCLGRNYSLSGNVIVGDQRGRTIGFPTANLDVWEEKVIPANGVYAAWVILSDGSRHMTATNVGVRPTVDGQSLRVEAHLLDFSGDLYGQELQLEFVDHIRSEKRFSGLEELKNQINTDVELIRGMLQSGHQ
ncbi:MAG: riboflavin kinase/FMN adenylyltransferase [Cellvibrionaceae bacterium]|jgi:riboflavin kinase/FMN adenylyltransferase